MTRSYHPEGHLFQTEENKRTLLDLSLLQKAIDDQTILEARVVRVTKNCDLILDLGPTKGIIPKEEGAMGITEGMVREIALISRAGKAVAFIPQHITFQEGKPTVICSRRLAQEACRKDYLDSLREGDILPARVTHTEPFGVFADVGCGISALLPIDAISISRISHPAERFAKGEEIFAVLRARDDLGRLVLTMKELLGSWAENAAGFAVGETVCGMVRSVEDYGVFVELTPNLAGLAEKVRSVEKGMVATVYIKSILPEKMKVKLALVDAFFPEEPIRTPLQYTKTSGHISHFLYSPDGAKKQIESRFSA